MTAVFASQQGRVVDYKCFAQPDIARLVHSVAPEYVARVGVPSSGRVTGSRRRAAPRA